METTTRTEAGIRILKGAHELFFRCGIKSVTMDDIAKHLGMSKKTIYQSFSDKDEIVYTLSSGILQDHKHNLNAIEAQSKDAIDEIIQSMKYMAAMFTQMNPNLFYDMQKYHQRAWAVFREFKENYIMEMVIKNIEKGQKQGLYRTDLNANILAKLRIEEVEMGMQPMIFPPDKFNIVEVEVAMLDHWLYGVCTLKGHKLINKYKQLEEEE